MVFSVLLQIQSPRFKMPVSWKKAKFEGKLLLLFIWKCYHSRRYQQHLWRPFCQPFSIKAATLSTFSIKAAIWYDRSHLRQLVDDAHGEAGLMESNKCRAGGFCTTVAVECSCWFTVPVICIAALNIFRPTAPEFLPPRL